jgi:hypothetical protein
MRTLLRARFIFPFTIAAALGVWVACGGSDAQDVTNADAGGRVDSGGPVIVTPPPPPPEDAAVDSGTRPFPDAGRLVILDGGDVDGGIPCFEGGELEVEPNNTNVLANTLSRIRCGVTKGAGGTGSADPDVMTFTIRDASANFDLDYQQRDGTIRVVVETDGAAPVDISEPGASLGKVRYDQPYYATITSKDSKQVKWVLVLTEHK